MVHVSTGTLHATFPFVLSRQHFMSNVRLNNTHRSLGVYVISLKKGVNDVYNHRALSYLQSRYSCGSSSYDDDKIANMKSIRRLNRLASISKIDFS